MLLCTRELARHTVKEQFPLFKDHSPSLPYFFWIFLFFLQTYKFASTIFVHHEDNGKIRRWMDIEFKNRVLESWWKLSLSSCGLCFTKWSTLCPLQYQGRKRFVLSQNCCPVLRGSSMNRCVEKDTAQTRTRPGLNYFSFFFFFFSFLNSCPLSNFIGLFCELWMYNVQYQKIFSLALVCHSHSQFNLLWHCVSPGWGIANAMQNISRIFETGRGRSEEGEDLYFCWNVRSRTHKQHSIPTGSNNNESKRYQVCVCVWLLWRCILNFWLFTLVSISVEFFLTST